ncbi:protein FAM83H [Gadus chalcogrammus]|uniref:protein FAM83H n=1 Tax=Gadus chalcogrammus TaxID=1042646 RepID=UPI0024C4E1BA|nr:protein FAM83H [Gadus chalcogrammus]XP_056438491.1 protein FAM83H [Gadus chalcogrammus]
MAHRSQSSSVGDNPLDPNYLPPHYREEYRLAIDALIEDDSQGYYEFLQKADVVPFLSQPEIDHIKSTLQTPSQSQSASMPELTYHEGVMEDDGSSDTYWPVHSDLDAPGLDLGWPQQQHSFIGPTEVTTLINPSDPEMPSIKEQARRLIKSAYHVIAVVMDIFTDVDIFSDLLDAAARRVPVYILLDEQNAHHFVAMVNNCRVNLDLIQMMRVRTVAGITYYCRTGKSFKGQVKDRFLLADCRAVISGNYSFMWSYEKIHRCIAHLFLGELVASFDEEFRILFAQSEPLIIDQSIVPHGNSDYQSSQFGLKRSQSLLSNRAFPRQNELPSALPYGESERNPLAFRRNEPFRHSMEPTAGITIGKYAQQQFHLQQSYLEQGRSIVSRQMELSSTGFKRHSYAEGTQESYSSSKQYMKHRVMNNLEETDYQREQTQQRSYYHEGPEHGSGHGHYDRLQMHASNLALDQRSESSYTSEPPVVGGYSRDYFSSDDLKGPEGLHGHHEAGRYEGVSTQKRPTLGQPFACQNSPTQPHPPEKQPFLKPPEQERDQDPSARQGMRSWRINSFLSTYEDGGEEGLPQALGPDAFDDDPSAQQVADPQRSTNRYGIKEMPSKPDVLRPRFGKPVLHDNSEKDSGTTRVLQPSTTYSHHMMEKEREKESDMERDRLGTREGTGDVEMKEGPEVTVSKNESFRTRVNPMLMRSSRLRSSLIFSSSKVEKHSGGLGLNPATEEDEDLDHIRTTSIVAQMLEKRKSLNREPFEWRKKTEEKDKDDEKQKVPAKEKGETSFKDLKDKFQNASQEIKTSPAEAPSNVTAGSLKTQQESSLNMNDPASRLQYFKDLAAKRKASRMETETALKAIGPIEKKPDLLDKTHHSTATHDIPSVSVNPPEPEPKKLDISSRLAELTRRSSVSGNKPPAVSTKPSVNQLKPTEPDSTRKAGNGSEVQKKDPFKSLKPFPSPNIFRKDPLKLKALNPRRVSSGEDMLTADATDAEKSELKKSRSHSSSSMMRSDSRDVLNKYCGSNTSINTIGSDGKSEGKPLDFLKKQTQRLKGLLGPKDKDKKSAASADEKTMRTVVEITEDSSKKSSTSSHTGSSNNDQPNANHKVSAGTSGPSRYQSTGGSVLFSSNLRDDTKVILGQISANSQKNRLDQDKAGGAKEGDPGDKGLERQNSLRKTLFSRPQTNPQEREGLLKRMESMRKEKKVYSRFEMGNNLG